MCKSCKQKAFVNGRSESNLAMILQDNDNNKINGNAKWKTGEVEFVAVYLFSFAVFRHGHLVCFHTSLLLVCYFILRQTEMKNSAVTYVAGKNCPANPLIVCVCVCVFQSWSLQLKELIISSRSL